MTDQWLDLKSVVVIVMVTVGDNAKYDGKVLDIIKKNAEAFFGSKEFKEVLFVDAFGGYEIHLSHSPSEADRTDFQALLRQKLT